MDCLRGKSGARLWPGILEHNFATILEVARHAPLDCFLAALDWLDEFLGIVDTLCARREFFSRVDEANQSSPLRIMAVLPVHHNPEILEYIAETEDQDLGIITLALLHPVRSPAVARKLQLRLKQLVNSTSEYILYCGQKIVRQEGLAISKMQKEIAPVCLLPDTLFCKERVKSVTKLGYFEVKEGHVINFRLDHLELHSIPSAIWKFSALEALDLSNNLLTTIPAIWQTVPALKYLELRFNHIDTLPSGFENLLALEKLDITFNHFEIFPDAVALLTALKDFKWGNNKIKALSSSAKDLLTRIKDHVYYFDFTGNG